VKRTITALLAAAAATTAALAAQATADAPPERERDVLTARAILPNQPARTGETVPPYPGQPLGGYSALVDAPGRDTYWAMPDNGYGSATNSQDFLLRVDLVRVDWDERRRGGDGDVEVLRRVYLSDPGRRVPFPIVDDNGAPDRGVPDSGRRLLTGSDFDPESFRIAADGSWWFGDELGPFLLRTDPSGRVLDPPYPLPGVRAPENELPSTPENRLPEQPNLRSSSGFEGMARSPNGRYLYPVLERSLDGEDTDRRKRIYEFDTRERRYTGRQWSYLTDPIVVTDPPGQSEHVIGDFTTWRGDRILAIERDFRTGEAARVSRIYEVDLSRADANGFLRKRLVVDLLDIADPFGISERTSARFAGVPGGTTPPEFGVGDPFRFPYVTTESVLPEGNELVVVNDNNFGSRGGRGGNRVDYTDFIRVRPDETRGEGDEDREEEEDHEEEDGEDREEERQDRHEDRDDG